MITVYRANTGWMADFSQAADAERVYALFGGYILPTAYTAAAEANRVLAAIRRANPTEQVVRH